MNNEKEESIKNNIKEVNQMNVRQDEIRKELSELQLKKEKILVEAQEIVLKHLESAIEIGDSATVAAMAEILKN